MLDLSKLVLQLNNKIPNLLKRREERRRYSETLTGQIEKLLERGDGEAVIAEKTGNKVVLKLNYTFQKATDLNRWALKVLRGVTVVAVDGSQVEVSKHITPSLGLINVGFSVRIPGESEGFCLSGSLPVVVSGELLEKGGIYQEDLVGSHAFISFLRWRWEVKVVKCIVSNLLGVEPECNGCEAREICELSRLKGKINEEVKSSVYVLLDSPLILSFAKHYREPFSSMYIEELEDLLDFLSSFEVSVAGVIANSFAREVVNTLWSLSGKPLVEVEKPLLPPDSVFLNGRFLREFGDRTPFFLSRRDILRFYRRWRDKIGFFYVKTSTGLPLRIETPDYVCKKGLLKGLWEVVCADATVGKGYPFSLAKAHETCVVNARDRELFYRVLDTLLRRFGFSLSISPKEARKRQPIA